MPKTLFAKCAQAGWLAGVIGAPWRPQFAGTKLAGGIKPEEFDAFHVRLSNTKRQLSSAFISSSCSRLTCCFLLSSAVRCAGDDLAGGSVARGKRRCRLGFVRHT
jgi:hypothetical protein